jgi:hypothetical protein
MLSETAPALAEAVKNGDLAITEAGPLQESGTRPAPGCPSASGRGALKNCIPSGSATLSAYICPQINKCIGEGTG